MKEKMSVHTNRVNLKKKKRKNPFFFNFVIFYNVFFFFLEKPLRLTNVQDLTFQVVFE